MSLLISGGFDQTWDFHWISDDEKRSQLIKELTNATQNVTVY